MPMSLTERDRLVHLEGEVNRLKNDLTRLAAEKDNEIADLRNALYGKGPNDKNSVFAQLMSLQNDRAIRIWFVSICAGIGSTIVAAVILNMLPGHG